MNHNELNRAEFEHLLTWLSPNKQEAGQMYENIRYKLLKFFEWRGCFQAEECTDQTMDRVMAKVAHGEEIRTQNQYLYFLGVGKNVLLEYFKQQKKKITALDTLPQSQLPAVDPGEIEAQQSGDEFWQQRLQCMRQCLQTLQEEKRAMITGYYQGKRRTKIENRQRLAQWLHLSENALRIRTHRIREELEACIQKCMKE